MQNFQQQTQGIDPRAARHLVINCFANFQLASLVAAPLAENTADR